MSGALSDERTGLSFARVTVRISKSFVSMYNLHLHVIKSMYICMYVYTIYTRASVSPGSVQQIIPYY
jgi:hypothetical protein